nr:hypothetical protein [Chitinispirillaceae bacterium]
AYKALVVDEKEIISIMLNEEDHLRVLSIDSGLAPLTLWHSVDEVDDQLGQELQFAFDRTRGFLSCCPTNSGTGLRASFLLHLPGLVLTKAIDAVLQGASQMGIATRGFFGEHSEVVGNYFQLSNQAAMGMSEAGVVEHARLAIAAVVTAERQARVRLMNDAILPLTDKIMRAYGILQYAKTLSVAEYLSIASALRLGSDCGILTEIDSAQLDLAMLCIMPAHVQQCAGRDMDETESSVVRADLARELLLKPVRKRKPRSSHEKQN